MQKPFWPTKAKKITYLSNGDGTKQPALFYLPEGEEVVPLLVALHTWNGTYTQPSNIEYLKWCIGNNWAFISPEFRGANNKPDATGSELVVNDIISAVRYAESTGRIDKNRIYLIGVSGGGYTALLMAAKYPEMWAGVSAWCPIVDLKLWYDFCKKNDYKDLAKSLEQSCNGTPEDQTAIQQYIDRSPITYLKSNLPVHIELNVGIYDGHAGSVPVNQTLKAFNMLALQEDRLSEKEIEFITNQAAIPENLKQYEVEDVNYSREIYLRKHSNNVVLTIFDGGHEVLVDTALTRLSSLSKKSIQQNME